MVQSNQLSSKLKKSRAEGQSHLPVSAKHMLYACGITPL